jgi:hypothetical protein
MRSQEFGTRSQPRANPGCDARSEPNNNVLTAEPVDRDHGLLLVKPRRVRLVPAQVARRRWCQEWVLRNDDVDSALVREPQEKRFMHQAAGRRGCAWR